MKKLLNNKTFKCYFLLLLFIISLELIFRGISGVPIFSVSLLRIILGANIISLTLSVLFSWLPEKGNKIINIILCLILSIYAFLQLGFNNFIGVYMSINTKSQLGAVKDYVKEFLASFLGKYYLIFIPFIILLICHIVIDKKISKKEEKKFNLKPYTLRGCSKTLVSISILFTSCIIYYASLTASFMQNELQTVKTKDLFFNPNVPSIVVNEFGILGFGLLDIKSSYFPIEESSVVYAEKNDEDNYIETSRKIDDTLWKEVVEKENDPVKNSISNYLLNRPISDYNEYTGIFKDKNLIVIMMESINEILINAEYYPNFYKVYTEGWSFTNNYSPRNSCSTGNNEFSGMTSLYTIYNNCTANVYKNNTYSSSIFNLFNNAGYQTSSMHNYTEAYYFRKTIHPNLGSGRYYGVEDLKIDYYNEYKNWSSDEDFMHAAMDIVLKNNQENPFMLWLTTVSSHQPYVKDSIEGNKYISLFNETNYPQDLKRYMSKLKTFDNDLGILLDELESNDLLKDTVLVLFGDHYPYGLKNETLNYVLDYDLDEYEVERTPFVIYSSEQKPQVNAKYTSFMNLTPTIANLFGLEYDPRLYMGKDLFSDSSLDYVTFADGSWKNDFAYYDASQGTIKYYKDQTLSVEEIKRINNEVTSKMNISSLIIKNNYFAYLDEAINKIKAEKETLAIDIGKEEK